MRKYILILTLLISYFSQAQCPIINVSSNGPICEGTYLELYADSAATASYSWTGPNGFSSTLQNPIINSALPINSGIYNLTVTTTSPVCTINVSTALITVGANPVVTSTFTNVTCFGGNNGQINITAPSNNNNNYTWNNGATTASLSNLIAGNYNLTITDTIVRCGIDLSFIITSPQKILNSFNASNFNNFNTSCFGSTLAAGLAKF